MKIRYLLSAILFLAFSSQVFALQISGPAEISKKEKAVITITLAANESKDGLHFHVTTRANGTVEAPMIWTGNSGQVELEGLPTGSVILSITRNDARKPLCTKGMKVLP